MSDEAERKPIKMSVLLADCAAEAFGDAQLLDNSPSLTQRLWSHAKLAEQRNRSWPLFFVMLQIIGAVSAYDAFLAIKYRTDLPHLEQNVVGQLLLKIDGNDPALFVGVKFLGTMMVLGILASLFNSHPQRAMRVGYGVTACQICLLAYLTCG